jgi:anti-sigma B factor antagonist
VRPDFTISVAATNPHPVLSLAGELDLATAPELAEELRRIEGPEIELDLARLAFIDASGLRVIAEAADECERRGRRLVVRNAPPTAHRILEIVGLEGLAAPS